MGMGYSACRAWIITEEKLAELNLPTWEKFKQTLEEAREGIDECAYYDFLNGYLNPEEYPEEDLTALVEAWESLQTDFKERTGLGLDINYHDCESDGSRYDDVDGIFYTVGNVESFTLAGSKAYNAGLIDKAWWVTFG